MGKYIAIAFSGILWLAVGSMLLMKGLRLLVAAGLTEKTTLGLVSIALLIGFIKGRFVLAKTVRRVVSRIASLPKVTFFNLYEKKYLLLLGSMILLGISLKFLPLAPLILGFIDVTIGSALINGALLYIRYIRMLQA